MRTTCSCRSTMSLATLTLALSRARSQQPTFTEPRGGDMGACRTASGDSGRRNELWELSQAECEASCAAMITCVAYEHNQMSTSRPGRFYGRVYQKCEIHADTPTHTVPREGSVCRIKVKVGEFFVLMGVHHGKDDDKH